MARPKRDGIAEVAQLLREVLADDRLPEEARTRLSTAYEILAAKVTGAMSKDEFVALRKSLGRTQEDLAQDLGKRVRQIARYESGEVPIPVLVAQMLKELADKK
ncbi:helix-turn-helix domain-containing protein [Nitrospirillum bahiense]|uniref:Helix-turn-helix protein n=1 Tax=Nitrospirillum amazonense TaxID=28077 RepID=A0A560FVQ0_9PROT|nr:helix-turn-helix domain-containing protein [Nitrospirillum amazonense]TWB25723.1 helix-turn-helix protein [Nitrospirillum amazonense]